MRLGKKDAKDDDKPKNEKKAGTEPKGAGAEKKGAAAATDPSHIDMLWLVQNGFAIAAVGTDPKDALRSVVKTAPEASLGADANVKAAIDDLGADVAFTLFADVPRLVAARVGKPAPKTSAPLVFSFGKTSHAAGVELEAKLDVANAALQDLIRNRSAF